MFATDSAFSRLSFIVFSALLCFRKERRPPHTVQTNKYGLGAAKADLAFHASGLDDGTSLD